MALRAFLTAHFAKFARKGRISSAALRKAVAEVQANPSADLGGGLFKQRVARAGGGKSGGYRTIVVLRRGKLAVFLYGFAKNERENLDADELKALKKLAKTYLNASDADIDFMRDAGEIKEVGDDGEEEDEEGQDLPE